MVRRGAEHKAGGRSAPLLSALVCSSVKRGCLALNRLNELMGLKHVTGSRAPSVHSHRSRMNKRSE